MRLKKRQSVGRVMRYNDYQTFLEAGEAYRVEKYKHYLNTQLFDSNKNATQTEILFDYDSNLRLLKAIKQKYSRGASSKFLEVSGIEKFGGLENYRQFLIDGGYTRESSYKIVKKLRQQIHEASFFFGSDGVKLTNLYNEVYMKFAS
jgi:hypothetical protein